MFRIQSTITRITNAFFLSAFCILFTGALSGQEAGSRVSSRTIRQTGQQSDVVALGPSLLRFQLNEKEQFIYARSATLRTDGNGQLGFLNREKFYRLEPLVLIPSDANELRVKSDGTVLVRCGDEPDLVEAGVIMAYLFPRLMFQEVANGLVTVPDDAAPEETRFGNRSADILLCGWLENQ